MLDIIWTILFLGGCSVTDIKERKINLWYCIVNIIVMIIVNVLWRDYNIWSIVGGVIFAGAFLAISKVSKEAIGMGDVFMIMTIGIVCGVVYTMKTLFWSFTICLVFSGVGVVLGKINLKSKLPFAPFMLMGTVALALSKTNIVF